MLLLSALVFGFLGSLHCLGMCGPIAFMLPVNRESKTKSVTQLSLYHFGRFLAYGIIGVLFGFLGKGLSLFGMQQKLSIAVGILMLILVFFPGRYFKAHKLAAPIYRLIGAVKSKLGQELRKKSNDTFLTIGFLNGFLPCGLVYMALLGAVALSNPWYGGLYMMLFGLGTVPLMTAVVFSKGLFRGRFKSKIKKAIPVFVVLIGGFCSYLGDWGWEFHMFHPSPHKMMWFPQPSNVINLKRKKYENNFSGRSSKRN